MLQQLPKIMTSHKYNLLAQSIAASRIPEGTIVCPGCNARKLPEDFYTGKPKCKVCVCAYNSYWYNKDHKDRLTRRRELYKEKKGPTENNTTA